ncbi:MAG TPA: DUF72 domain-containing protein [Opitutaceae bacterium]|nr:DUF72 domain-containing protein [Opitutaceae bacterium]
MPKAPARPSPSGIRIGISGWTYAPWRGVFFPPGLAQKDELAYAARQVSSIEINGTFYSLQRPSSYGLWHDQAPPDFVFSVKGPRFITHIRRLKDAAIPLANFFASGVLRLEEKLGPLLWQLPPSLPYDPERLDAFFELLPRDTLEAAALARRHDAHVPHPWLEPGGRRPLRHALEIRHRSFERPEFIEQLRRHGIALVVADTAGKWPLLEESTCDFMYARLHGDEKLYVSGYTEAALARWARKVRAWRAAGQDVYVYFDNDVKVRAPHDAQSLAHRLGLGSKPKKPPPAASIREAPRTRWPGFPPRPGALSAPPARPARGAPARRKASARPAAPGRRGGRG